MPLRCDEVEKKQEADGRARVVSVKSVPSDLIFFISLLLFRLFLTSTPISRCSRRKQRAMPSFVSAQNARKE